MVPGDGPHFDTSVSLVGSRFMLNQIYCVAKDFETEHGFCPNIVYMNYAHLECLKQQLDDPNDFNAILVFMGMELIIEQDAYCPSVAWAKSPWKEAVHV